MNIVRYIVQISTIVIAISAASPRIAVADAEACKGGSCLSAGGVKLDCPTSGSKICKAGECCGCTCVPHASNGTTAAQNTCSECPKAVDIDGTIDEVILNLIEH